MSEANNTYSYDQQDDDDSHIARLHYSESTKLTLTTEDAQALAATSFTRRSRTSSHSSVPKRRKTLGGRYAHASLEILKNTVQQTQSEHNRDDNDREADGVDDEAEEAEEGEEPEEAEGPVLFTADMLGRQETSRHQATSRRKPETQSSSASGGISRPEPEVFTYLEPPFERALLHSIQASKACASTEDEGVDEKFCFFCDHSQNTAEQIANPRFKRCARYYEDNYDGVDTERIARHVCDDYNNNLRKYTRLQKKMHWRMVHEHFTQHTPSMLVMSVDSLKYINDCMTTISRKNTFMFGEQSKREKLDTNNVKLYLTMFEKRARILREIQNMRANA